MSRDRNLPLAIELAMAGVRCPCVISEASGVTHLTAQSIVDALDGEGFGTHTRMLGLVIGEPEPVEVWR